MNRKLSTVLLLAFLVAAACFYAVYRIEGRRAAAARPVATVRVVAAAADIKLGAVLTASDLTTMQVAGSLPKGAILKPENAIGRGVMSPLYQGEPVLDARLAPVGSGGGLAATIRPGMRACAVKVDEVVGVAGFVTPGMRVDVLISGDPPGPARPDQGTLVKTLLQNIEVLSAGTDIQKDNEGKPQQVHVVNLLVTPEQAEVLSLASNQTHIQLVLRNPMDTQVAQVTGSAMGNLFSGSRSAAPAVAKSVHKAAPSNPATGVVEIFNGSQRSEQKFAAPGGQQ
jgi:pilus assembly protein CpaB